MTNLVELAESLEALKTRGLKGLRSADADPFYIDGWEDGVGRAILEIADVFDDHNPDPPENTDETILQEANRLVYGERAETYGHPYDDYMRTSRIWEAMLGMPPGSIGPRKAALMMCAVKLSREMNMHKRDNLTDLAGYAAVAMRIEEIDPMNDSFQDGTDQDDGQRSDCRLCYGSGFMSDDILCPQCR